MFWMLAHDEYPNYDGFNLYDKDVTTYVDDFTAIQKAKGGKKVICKKCKAKF